MIYVKHVTYLHIFLKNDLNCQRIHSSAIAFNRPIISNFERWILFVAREEKMRLHYCVMQPHYIYTLLLTE